MDDHKLQEIRHKIDAIKSQNMSKQKQDDQKAESQDDMRIGLQAGAELITAITAGGLIGYYLDQWFETKPIFLIALLILGVITGFINIWRTTQNIGYKIGYKDQMKNNNERR